MTHGLGGSLAEVEAVSDEQRAAFTKELSQFLDGLAGRHFGRRRAVDGHISRAALAAGFPSPHEPIITNATP